MDVSYKPTDIESVQKSPEVTNHNSPRTDYGAYCTPLPSFHCNGSNTDNVDNTGNSCLETFCYPFTCFIDTILNCPCPV